jgi:hypothetical protein
MVNFGTPSCWIGGLYMILINFGKIMIKSLAALSNSFLIDVNYKNILEQSALLILLNSNCF